MAVASKPIEKLLERLERVTPRGDGWEAQCPAHDDAKNSLCITEKSDKTVLIKCQAGCDTRDVLAAIDLRLKDLFPPREQNNGKGAIVAAYRYCDERGALLYESVRYESKDFSVRTPGAGGGWNWKLNGARRVPYRLPELAKADAARTVLIVEGEKDADRLCSLKFVATTNVFGAKKWRREYNEHLRGRPVAILADNDDTGREHAQQVARSLHGTAASIKVIEFSELPKAGDVSDWLDAGGTADELKRRIVETPEWEPTPEREEPETEDKPADTRSSTTDYNRTEYGNSERFVDQHGRDVRFCHPFGKWYVWEAGRWTEDESGDVSRRAKETVRKMWSELTAIADDSDRKEMAGWIARSEAATKIDAMLKLSRSAVPVVPSQLDADPWKLNVENGTIDLRTGELRPHNRDDLMTKRCPVTYDSEAEAPQWETFIKRIFAGDADLIRFVQRWLGYRLTGDVREQVLPIFWGNGSNGKSTLLDTVTYIMGEYADEAPQHLLTERRGGDEHPTEIADLCGKRLIVASETEKGRKLRVQLMKMLTGNARLKGRFCKKDFFSFDRTFEPVLVTNNKPRIRENTKAVWRRVQLVPFKVTIPDSEIDDQLPQKLRAEAPGILRWLVKGCLEWQRDGLGESDAVNEATAAYRDESDPLREFIAESCIIKEGCWAKSSDLRTAYEAFCAERGDRPVDGDDFTDSLRQNGCEPKRRNVGRGWAGIGLLTDGESAAEFETNETEQEDLFAGA